MTDRLRDAAILEGYEGYQPGVKLYTTPQPAKPSDDTMYLLRRLLSNQHTLTGPEFRQELAKIVEDAYSEASQRHPDDAAVDAFAQAMKEKLAAARAKGRDGWQTCPPDDLSRMLREHVEKGDPRDVANFCMFLWSLGHAIEPAQQPSTSTKGEP